MNADQERLLGMAKQLRRAAADAGRQDVVAKVDDAILLLAGSPPPRSEDEKTNVVLRILDGLGF